MDYKDQDLKSAIITAGVVICIIGAIIVWMFNG
jgi:hypothetical protein